LHKQVRYKYQYDTHGNWTERVVSVRLEQNPDFQRSNIERRKISYYASCISVYSERMKPLTITCTLMFLALLAAPVMDASACSCATVGSNPPCQAAWGVAAVFTGTVVEITEPSLVVPP